MKGKPVLVTTKYRGVFFGYVPDGGADKLPAEITLERARMCIYWSREVRGVLGLAATGPNSACRIGAAVPTITLWDVTSVTDCTPGATEKLEAAPWN